MLRMSTAVSLSRRAGVLFRVPARSTVASCGLRVAKHRELCSKLATRNSQPVYGSRMRSIRLIEPAAPLQEQEMPDPRPEANEVVVDIRAAGICHSDAYYRAGRGRVA